MTKKVNPIAHAAGKHRKGSSDASVPLSSQAQGHAIWALSVCEGEWKGAEAPADGRGRDTKLPVERGAVSY